MEEERQIDRQSARESRFAHALARTARAAREIALLLIHRFREDRCLDTAGSLTFTTLLAIVPLLTVVLAISSAFPVFDKAVQVLQIHITENWLPNGTGVAAIGTQIRAFADTASRLAAVGLDFLAVTALMLMLTIDEALNRVFRVRRRRSLVRRLVMYWSVLTLGPVLIGASLGFSTLVLGRSLGWLDATAEARTWIERMPLLFTWAAFTMLYTLVPYRRIDLRHALAGGWVAGVLFELAKHGFSLYIAKFPTYSLIYGAFAALPVFLVWLYLSWLVVLVGAVLTATWPEFGRTLDRPPPIAGRELPDVLRVLAHLARVQEGGGSIELDRLASGAGLGSQRCEDLLERCAALGWTAKSRNDGWLLARRADSIRVADVYRSFVFDAQALTATGLPGDLGQTLVVHDRSLDVLLSLSVEELRASL